MSAAWVRRQCFTRPGDDRWQFRGIVRDKEGGTHTVTLFRARCMRIRRHVKVKGEANPYAPAWELYFEEPWVTRLATPMASTLTGRGTARYLWLVQGGKCPVCRPPLTLEFGWHVHHVVWGVHGGTDTVGNLVLLHPHCHRQVYSRGLVLNKAASREGRL